MAVSYTWNVSNVEVQFSKDGFTDVITTVHWRYVGEENGHEVELYGMCNLPDPQAETFVEYASVTANDVQTWVEGCIGAEQVASMQMNIADQLAEKQTPTHEFRTIGS